MGIYRLGPMYDSPRPEAGPVCCDATANLVSSGRTYPNTNADPNPNPHWSPANPDRDAIAHADSGTYYVWGGFDRNWPGAGRNARLALRRSAGLESDWQAGHCNSQLRRFAMHQIVREEG